MKTHIDKPLGDNQCISPSALNTWIRCPALYLWSYILKIPSTKEPFVDTQIGLDFHELAEKKLNGVMLTDSTIKDLLHNNENKYFKNVLLAEVKLMVEEGWNKVSIIDTELKISSWNNRRVGYVDRIDEMSDGSLCVTDYKPKDKRKYPSDVKRQIHFYANQINHLIDIGKLDYDQKITHGKILGYKDSSYWYFPIKKITTTAMEKQITKLLSSTEFPCKNNNLCYWCEYDDTICKYGHKTQTVHRVFE